MPKRRISKFSLRSPYELQEIDDTLKAVHTFKCHRFCAGEGKYITASFRNGIHFKQRVIKHIRFAERVYSKGGTEFVVTFTFGGKDVITIQLHADAAALPAAQFWLDKFNKTFPEAPLSPTIGPRETAFTEK